MSCQELRQSRKLRTDYDVAVPLHLKTGNVACPELDHEVNPRLLSRADEEAVAGAKDAVEAAILAPFFLVHGHPYRIDAVRIFGADRPGDRVDATRADAVLVDRERQFRGTGALPFPETCGDEQDGYRPWNFAERFSRNAVNPSFMSCVAARRPK